MKPERILIFMLITAAIAIGIALLFPADGISISNDLRLKFHLNLSAQKTDTAPTTQIAKIDSIINQFTDIEDDTVQEVTQNAVTEIVTTDTQPNREIKTIAATKPAQKNINKNLQRIEFPEDSDRFKTFFGKLKNCSNSKVRILHYGDSQIEGDRITGYLRNLMQKRFGGSGPGLMPATPPIAKSSAVKHTASNNWRQYSIYQKKDTSLHHSAFGIMGYFGRFTPESAWIEFSESEQAYRSVRNFTQCRVYYGNANTDFTVKGYINNNLKWFEEIKPTADTKMFNWDFEQVPKRFRIEFDGIESPDIYAITLDSPTGVAVDNLPFRGSKGTEFVKLNLAQMKQMGRYLPVGLIIYEFGVNAVANNSRNYNYYEENLRKQLRYLKKVWPKADILIVGVSDMSEKNGDGYVTRSSVRKVIEAQRNAAFAEGCAFWNLYEAMGGYNSMPVWVNSHMAQKDYTHFNREGGHRVAQMLFDAIMAEEK